MFSTWLSKDMGSPRPWSRKFINIYLYKCKWRFLSGRLMLLAILLYGLFIHHKQINLSWPNRHDGELSSIHVLGSYFLDMFNSADDMQFWCTIIQSFNRLLKKNMCCTSSWYRISNCYATFWVLLVNATSLNRIHCDSAPPDQYHYTSQKS